MLQHKKNPSTKLILFAGALSVIIVGAAIVFPFLTGDWRQKNSGDISTNVAFVDGKQIIEIKVRGGYTPRKTTAKSGIPTVLRFATNDTFDCSSSVRIPSKSISKTLPQTGITDIEIGTPQEGKMNGMCGMGMYSFEIYFQG